MSHKPCPFCGSENVQLAEGANFRWAKVECVDCGACGPEAQGMDYHAWHEWDARAEDKPCSAQSAST
mgnify:CR=1 FL=1